MSADHIKRVIILGSTGSIGTQTIQVIESLNAHYMHEQVPWRYEIVGLAAGRNADALFAQARELGVREVALADAGRAEAPANIKVRRGNDAAEQLVREVECDIVLASMVGSAGVPATLAALQRGTDVALANKETLVAAGSIVVDAANRSGARLLPVDSEHSGVWQCLAGRGHGQIQPPVRLCNEVRKIILTASGGALRGRTLEETYHATPEDALAHPTWSMGAKVTIDSASLTNKALELIEAHWLFGVGADRLGVLIHPQSIVHSFVEFADRSVIAQCGSPDMRTPIQFALAFPNRPAGIAPGVDWDRFADLHFSQPDTQRFPALDLGYEVIERGGTAGAVMNAANEEAVEAFLTRKLPFGMIPEVTKAALDEVGVSEVRTLDDVFEADAEARKFVRTRVDERATV